MSSSTPVLYVYDHCPFCVKARMIFGLHGITFKTHIVLYDDIDGPTSMVGRKVVPILGANDRFMPESLEIVAHIEQSNTPLLTGPTRPEIQQWLSDITATAYRLFLPRAAAAPLPELATTSARLTFIRNKEQAKHPFSTLLNQSPDDMKHVNDALTALEPLIQTPDAVNGTLSYDDLHLFAQLRTLSLVRGIVYPPKVQAYQHRMSQRAHVPLFDALSA